VHGEGEWKVRVHGKAGRRVWRKLHLAVDTRTGELHAHALTPSEVHEAGELEGLLAGIEGPIGAVCADKAYDSFDCHAAVLAREARPVIPPRKGAAIRPPPRRKDVPPTRGAAVARIAEIGREAWKAETGYHRRSLAETAMFRYKTLIGSGLDPAPSTARRRKLRSPCAASTASPPSACPGASGSHEAQRERGIQPHPPLCNNAEQKA
jgi:Transposase DDE domain